MVQIFTRTLVPTDVDKCFDLARNIDLHIRSMSSSREEAIAGCVSGLIGLGESVTWRARHFGLWFTMTSRITAMQAPGYFRDEMVQGPFASFRHGHQFQAVGNSTLMTDILEVEAPLGFAGRLAECLFLRKYLLRLICSRNATIVAAAIAGN